MNPTGNGTLEACFLNTTLGFPCSQGSVSVVGVDARSPEDIQAAVNFAAKYNLRLVIKNTGHDFLGRSAAKGSFMIWTHHMKNITFDQAFTLVNSSVVYSDTFTLQAGVQWSEAYAAAASHNRVLVGGLSANSTVGSAGGWLAGGGHSMLSPTYGLGVDNVLQMTVVIADGTHLTVNEHSYSDLFWALRGGGGGTWGVVTSVTYRSHPNTPFSYVLFKAFLTQPNNASPDAAKNIVSELVRMGPTITSLGFGGMSIFLPPALFFGYASPTATWSQTNDTFGPFFEYAADQARTGGFTIQNYTASYPSFETMFPVAAKEVISMTGLTVGSASEAASRLIPADVATSDPDHLASVLLELPVTLYFMEAGGAVSKVDPDATGLHPAWRNALALTVITTGYADGITVSEFNDVRSSFTSDMVKLENLAPDSGAYMNEASPYEFDFKASFFGSHYDKLKGIKNKYDPSGLFIVHEGVGSDDWDASLNCRIKWD